MLDKKFILYLLLFYLTGIGGGWAAEKTPSEDNIEIKHLTLVPQAEPVPALKYRLWPNVLDLKIGNAALFYQAAASFCPDGEADNLNEKLNEWHEQAVDQWPRAEVEAVLKDFDKSFHQIDLGSLRKHCAWEMPIEDGFSMELPALAQYRLLTKAMTLKLRLQINDGQFEAALQTLQQGLKMAFYIAEGPTIIQDLVGVAMSARMLRGMESILATPGAPNLYWALTSLPVPYIDMRPSLEYEQQMIFVEFPALADLSLEVLTPVEASSIISEILAKARSLEIADDLLLQGVAPVAWVMLHYADAKTYLATQGVAAERIKAMPAAQAVLLYQVWQYQEIRDHLMKWFTVPYALGYTHLQEADRALSRHWNSMGVKQNFFLMLLPALSRVSFLQARLDRDIALLRTIEALRWYAAEHEDKFPPSLDAVRMVPIPRDPMTGRPFLYQRRDAKHARLEAPDIEMERKPRPVYELTIQSQ